MGRTLSRLRTELELSKTYDFVFAGHSTFGATDQDAVSIRISNSVIALESVLRRHLPSRPHRKGLSDGRTETAWQDLVASVLPEWPAGTKESSRTTSYEEARDLLRVKEGDIAKGVPVSPRTGKLRFDEAVADVLNDYAINGRKTHDHTKRRIDLHLTPVFRGRRMADITTADLRAFTRRASRRAPRRRRSTGSSRSLSGRVHAGDARGAAARAAAHSDAGRAQRPPRVP